jgi:predicted Zn-ribbon and HTH transcriptional regulator
MTKIKSDFRLDKESLETAILWLNDELPIDCRNCGAWLTGKDFHHYSPTELLTISRCPKCNSRDIFFSDR